MINVFVRPSRPVESHSGARGNILAGSQTFLRGPSGDTISNFLFKVVHSGVLYIFGRRRGPPNVAGPGVVNPPAPPSRRACVRPSIRADQSKTVQARIAKSSPSLPGTVKVFHKFKQGHPERGPNG